MSLKSDRLEIRRGNAPQMALSHPEDLGLVAIVGPKALSYANAVGTCGVSPVGQNWDRLASAARRMALAMVGDR